MAYVSDSSQANNLNSGVDLIKKAEMAFNGMERKNVETIWAELAEFVLPAQNGKFFGNRSFGVLKDRRTFDITAQLACRDLSAALHSKIGRASCRERVYVLV